MKFSELQRLQRMEGITVLSADERIEQLEARLRTITKERDALRVKVAEMERQEPVAWMLNCPALGGSTGWILSWTQSGAGLCNRLQGEENEKRLYALPGAQQCKNCNGMGDRFDPSGEKIPCDLCESHLEEIRSLVAEAAHDIISGSDFWLSTSLAAKKICALPGAKGEEK